MKESHWRATSLVLTTTLIVLVASWASAQSQSKATPKDPSEPAVVGAEGRVVIERSRARYVLQRGYTAANETDKYFLYDSWDVVETKDIWVLTDPHKVKNSWKRVPFEK